MRLIANIADFNWIDLNCHLMNTTRIVLTEPFVKQPAGQVIELDEATGVSGWEDDERLRERLSFSDKRVYYLPDGGNGAGYELPLHMTTPCPDEIFEGVDLRTGPCRVTGAWFSAVGPEEEASPSDLKYSAQLLEINGVHAQGIALSLPQQPIAIALKDVLRDIQLRQIPADAPLVQLNFSDLLPGFYQLTIQMPGGAYYAIRFMKAFPFLVTFKDNNGSYELHKTLY